MFAVLLSVLFGGLGPFQPTQSVPENLYVLGGTSQWTLIAIDLPSGQVVRSHPISKVLSIRSGLTYASGRLLAVDSGSGGAPVLPDSSLSLHPADGTASFFGTTGFNGWSFIPVAHDETRDETYVIHIWDVYRMEPTGDLTHLVTLQGGNPIDGITALAIDSSGAAWGTGIVGTYDIPLYRLDLQAGVATWQGGLLTPGGYDFRDLAFDSTGRLYGLLSILGGLYEVDLGSLSVQAVLPNLTGASIAFAPETDATTYCASKTTSTGCLPRIEGEGVASPTASSGFTVRATGARNRQFGMLLYGLNGPASQPFAGGLACIQTPWIRTRIVDSGGTGGPVKDCSGTWVVDLNAELARKPALPAGTTLNCQWMGRDPGYPAPDNYSLSDGLELTLLP